MAKITKGRISNEKLFERLEKMDWKLDQITAALLSLQSAVTSSAISAPSAPPTSAGHAGPVFPNFSKKQHAALQMIVRGAENGEIAERFNVTSDTVKVYVRTIAAKLQVRNRTQIAARMIRGFQEIDEELYLIASQGLPKDWDENYVYPDPYAHLYRKDSESGDGRLTDPKNPSKRGPDQSDFNHKDDPDGDS